MSKTNNKAVFLFLAAALVLASVAGAQTKVTEIKNVTIPLNFKSQDTVIKKGTYNFQVVDSMGEFYVRIAKGRKNICMVKGEEQSYGVRSSNLMTDPDVPEEPTIKIGKLSEENKLVIIIETGKFNPSYTCRKIKFLFDIVD